MVRPVNQQFGRREPGHGGRRSKHSRRPRRRSTKVESVSDGKIQHFVNRIFQESPRDGVALIDQIYRFKLVNVIFHVANGGLTKDDAVENYSNLLIEIATKVKAAEDAKRLDSLPKNIVGFAF